MLIDFKPLWRGRILDALIFVLSTLLALLDFVGKLATGFFFGMAYEMWKTENPEWVIVFYLGLFWAAFDAWKLYRDNKKKKA